MYAILAAAGVDLPRYAVLDRDSDDPSQASLEESDDYIVINGMQFNKPFVEKPVNADDHAVYIYYPSSGE